jgi:hypothetical protein
MDGKRQMRWSHGVSDQRNCGGQFPVVRRMWMHVMSAPLLPAEQMEISHHIHPCPTPTSIVFIPDNELCECEFLSVNVQLCHMAAKSSCTMSLIRIGLVPVVS